MSEGLHEAVAGQQPDLQTAENNLPDHLDGKTPNQGSMRVGRVLAVTTLPVKLTNPRPHERPLEASQGTNWAHRPPNGKPAPLPEHT